MTDPFMAEIRIFPFNFAPRGWAFCDGQLLPLAQFITLFTLLGTTYGGDAKTNFGLPNLQGRVPMHPAQGPGLTLRHLGETGGSETVSLVASEVPAHNHAMNVSQADGFDQQAAGELFAAGVGIGMYATPGPLTALSANAVGPAGGGQPHNNMQPYLPLYFNIALQGAYPPR